MRVLSEGRKRLGILDIVATLAATILLSSLVLGQAAKPDGYWLAWIGALPGCAAWGATKDEALAMLTHTARAYVRMLRDTGAQIPDTVETVNMPVVAVTL